MTYDEFIARKERRDPKTGFDIEVVNTHPFDWQKCIIEWACMRGRAAIWADCGLGKTLMQLLWAHHVAEHTSGSVLILTPLAVANQTAREAAKFGVVAKVVATQDDCSSNGIFISNYEKIDRFSIGLFSGVVLDESSILKHHDGHYRTRLIEECAQVPYRLACTATPAPNDVMELCNHAEFLGAMTRSEMLSMWYTHDGGDTSKWRLKGHARNLFWEWVSSWAVMLRRPSDIGYADDGYELPELIVHNVEVDGKRPKGQLFKTGSASLKERREARRDSLSARCEAASRIIAERGGAWVVWCGLNDESSMMTALTGGCEVTGSQSDEVKSALLSGFSDGEFDIIVTKPRIGGFGLNWQHCSQQMFVGLGDSYEQYYQCIRRSWRFGQDSQVNIFVVTSETEHDVVENIKRKEEDAMKMAIDMVEAMQSTSVKGATMRRKDAYREDVSRGDGWTLHLGDCVKVVESLEDESVGYSIFSPPFSSLYTYSASDLDMGNSATYEEFFEHMTFLGRQLHRVIKPGRLLSFHCMLLPASLTHDGFIGLKDFRGDLIRIFQAAGFVLHSEVVIWKDPVTAMQRTKAIGLLHKQLKKDSALSRQGVPDYLVTMRKLGVNTEPVQHTGEEFPVAEWQKIASPVWMDINPSDTIQKERDEDDERHICPLQIEVIKRGLRLWSNPGDLVLSPFAGIGSEGYASIQCGRRFVGVELKESYWRQATENLRLLDEKSKQQTLFDVV